ncbi:hypothetical protein [Phenylobacterium sp.]|uniref:hypothetical protein n=1 Tax=Phenylobacterium sp. TaxID=1871053 RepID=UPI0025D14262|nr:hypothetical protein [Phenylobacterium sp.]
MTDVVSALDAYEWLQLLGLGGLAGALGQGVRTVVGLKKAQDAASAEGVSVGDVIAVHRIVVSLLIGFIAGALAAIGIFHDLANIGAQQILAVATAGYAGADFIEGFASRVSGSPGAPAGQEAVGTGSASRGAGADDAVG